VHHGIDRARTVVVTVNDVFLLASLLLLLFVELGWGFRAGVEFTTGRFGRCAAGRWPCLVLSLRPVFYFKSKNITDFTDLKISPA
jgi:hypothetical protein